MRELSLPKSGSTKEARGEVVDPDIEGIPPQETSPPDNSDAEEVLAGPEGDRLVEDVKSAVFQEYERTLLEGTSNPQRVELQKRHVEMVADLSEECVDILREAGIEITDQQLRIIQIYAYLHDALKIVPEREYLNFREEIAEIEKQIEQQRNSTTTAASGNQRPPANTTDDELNRLAQLKNDLENYERESLIHSGIDPAETRLLMHGEDSAGWAEQLLSDLGFNQEFIDEAKKSLMAHMPMPYVEKKLVEAQNRPEDSGSILPQHLEEGKYPLPQTTEGAVLYAADLLSMSAMAGPDLEKDPVGGCFDRILTISLSNSESCPEEAFNNALESLEANVKRLKNPPIQGREQTAQVERILGKKIGQQVFDKVAKFKEWLEEGINLGSETVSSFNDLAVYRNAEDEAQELDLEATLSRYYQAVGLYREEFNLSGSNIAER